MMATPELLHKLQHGVAYRFSDSLPDLPDKVQQADVGIYTVWKCAEFLYVGACGLSENSRPAKRLKDHASGGRGGDQFCLYVFDRYVLPEVTEDDKQRVRSGEWPPKEWTKELNARTGRYIRKNLRYRFEPVESAGAAGEVERVIQRGEWDAGPPLLNPR